MATYIAFGVFLAFCVGHCFPVIPPFPGWEKQLGVGNEIVPLKETYLY